MVQGTEGVTLRVGSPADALACAAANERGTLMYTGTLADCKALGVETHADRLLMSISGWRDICNDPVRFFNLFAVIPAPVVIADVLQLDCEERPIELRLEQTVSMLRKTGAEVQAFLPDAMFQRCKQTLCLEVKSCTSR